MLARTTRASLARTAANASLGLGREQGATCGRYLSQPSQIASGPTFVTIRFATGGASGKPLRPRPKAVVLASEARVVLGRSAPVVLHAERA